MSAERPREGDTVMICKHIWEASQCKVAVVPPPARKIRWTGIAAPVGVCFKRSDGTLTPPARFVATCHVFCATRASGEVDYIETVWRDGRFQVVDYQERA